ncbi:mycothiol transferase [Saccharopolyspora sp. NPDC002376]
MTSADVLVDAFGRIQEVVHDAVTGLDPDQLAARLDPAANSIGWLVWHLSRVQDDHVSDVAEVEQVWTAQGWAGRFGLPFAVEDIGYGHESDDVAAVRVDSGKLLTGYYDAVHAQTLEFVRNLTDDDLVEVVDAAWQPPVTLGVRLVSVIGDDLQHAGQAAFVRGILERAD